MYSLGDFYGSATETKNQISALANVKFTKTIVKDKKGNAIENKTKKDIFVGTPMLLLTDIQSNKRTIWSLDEYLKKYESDKSSVNLTQKKYAEIFNEKQRLEKLI
jgi:hypothetical protein